MRLLHWIMRTAQAALPLALVVRVALIAATLLLLVNAAPGSQRVTRMVESAQRAGNYAERQARYTDVMRLVGDQPAVYEYLIAASFDAGDYDAARMYLYALANHAGWNAERREWLRDVLVHEGDAPGETALLYAAVSDQSLAADPRALRQLAEQQIARGEWAEVEQTLERLLTVAPDDARALYWMGVLLALDDPEQAADYLNRAAVDRDWATRVQTVRAALAGYSTLALTDAHTRLGIALVGLGEWAFAGRALERAVEVNALNPTALAYLGFVRTQQGRNGLPDLEAAMAMSPNDPLIYYLLGQHWRLLDDHEAAYDAFVRAYALDGQNPALAVEVALSLQYRSDFPGAERWFRKAIELDPSTDRWQRALAAFYADTGFELASRGLAFIEQASAAFPNDADIAASLGWAYYQTHAVQQAYEALDHAVGLNPNSPRIRYYFGAVLEQRGDQAGAADAYWFVADTVGTDQGFGLLAARALQRMGYTSP